jgi:hypothetical protein
VAIAEAIAATWGCLQIVLGLGDGANNGVWVLIVFQRRSR